MSDHTPYSTKQFDVKFTTMLGLISNKESEILISQLLSVTELNALPNIDGSDHTVTFSFQDDEDNLVMAALCELVDHSKQLVNSLRISIEHYKTIERKLSRSHILVQPHIVNIRANEHNYETHKVCDSKLYLDVKYQLFTVINH